MSRYYYDPDAAPRKGSSAGRTLGIGCAGVIGIVVLLFLVSAMRSGMAPTSGSPSVNFASAPTPSPIPDKSQAVVIDPRQLGADPKSFVGRNVIVQGLAGNVEQKDALLGQPAYTWIDFRAGIPNRPDIGDESIVVEMVPKVSAILRQNCYRIYGVVSGTETVTTILTGAQHEAPVVRGYAWDTAPGSGYFCAPPSAH